MQDWLDGMAGPGYASAILWTLAALILLVVVLLVKPYGLFVSEVKRV